MLPSHKGGLNLPDLEAFWASLKMSWSRRLMAPSCLWQKILELNLLYINHSMQDIWAGGPKLLNIIASKLSNSFWKEILCIFASIMGELHFAKPYYFFNYNIFDNDFFSINGTELKSSDFHTLWKNRICQVGDFFDCNKSPPELLSLDQINRKYSINLNFLNFHRIKEVIKEATKNLNYKIFEEDLSDTKSPKLPLIHKLSCLQTKGCRIFYETLKTREWTECSTADSES